ncbi:S41 family peptidase [Prauserella flavalba]|uniref:S41 family peptidase n=1 Tax=Prauserella flavalba TaxID=1477506 RepID=UPI0036E560DE
MGHQRGGRRMRTAAALGMAALAVVSAAVPASGVDGVDGVDGVWRGEGYGTVISIGNGALTGYDITAVSCLPGALRGERTGPRTFRTADGLVATVRPHGRNRARLTFDGMLGARTLTRLPALPSPCTTPPPDGPLPVFDTFWHTYAENYPFFTAKGVDWRAEGERARSRITEDTTPDELYGILCGLLSPLHDAHTGLLASGHEPCVNTRPGTPDYAGDPALRGRIAEVTDANLGSVELRRFADGQLVYADLPDGTGYLRVTGFTGYTGAGTFAADRAELDRALDAIFTPTRVRGLPGLILDLRVNGGGADPLGLRLAARLTDTPHFAYAKRARDDAHDPASFTTPEPFFVHPYRGPRYGGPLAVLIGSLDVSAGETFVQALTNRIPRPVLIGQNTQGVYSDTMYRALPGRDWRAVVPNEEYLTSEGHTYDGTGIPPDVRVPVFTEAELSAGRDSALAEARRLLATESPQ